MKKIIIFVLALLFSFSFYAQTSKGSKLIGVSLGSLSFTSSESKTTYSDTPTEYSSEDSSFGVSVNPSVAWFIQDNFAVGGSVSLSMYSSKNDYSDSESATTSKSKNTHPSVYIGPYARYYFGGSDNGKPFAQFNFQYGFYTGKSESSYSGSSSVTTIKPKGDWNTGLSVGYEHFLGEYVGIYGSIGVNYGKSKTTNEYRPSTGTGYDYTYEYKGLNIPVNFGIQVHLPMK